jgi:hypothetical protein
MTDHGFCCQPERAKVLQHGGNLWLKSIVHRAECKSAAKQELNRWMAITTEVTSA